MIKLLNDNVNDFIVLYDWFGNDNVAWCAYHSVDVVPDFSNKRSKVRNISSKHVFTDYRCVCL